MSSTMSPDLAHIDSWIFDLDNTLYPADVAFFNQIVVKMNQFVSRYLSLEPVAALHLQKEYLAEYGTTLSGMMAVHGMDPAAFLDYVHDVDLDFLKPNPALRKAIAALPGQKYIFTNGSKGHARNVASHLKLFDLFDGHFGVEDTGYIPKPKAHAYDVFLDVFNVDPTKAIFFEDNLRNLEVPKELGMRTVLLVSDEDWSHEPEAARPAGANTEADFVDYVSNDLAKWLETHT
ncbi:pyrimidine 5'-nucleotidase [Litorimonas cladophorae]|uniref:Pyrimidine 5'-nucleotidase n=1 Tax=Litorimonas cladophorae TaxID=1220491 RepID=A0A918NIV7_9PROT|nr:pyrimidine 5'-nucleotidase [Litorimonas cladophorae]GGX73359.1 pyrimidine 5'-nucleotidase [Litorimonas cladophorae]